MDKTIEIAIASRVETIAILTVSNKPEVFAQVWTSREERIV